ncbi:carbohydrate ABC transporter permease, partial [Gorillibacterium massiliense]|uniref:carbohydrate ABC transporter permease n=1 Tax=Gorillibacterium massiliense TaxID=1280390 RepID=UPI000593703C
MTPGKLAAYVLFAVLFLTQIYPLFWLLTYSLKNNDEILSGKFFAMPKHWLWENYKAAIDGGHYVQYLLNSLKVTSITMISVILLAGMVSFAITRFRFKYGNLIMLVFLMGMMIPLQSTLLPLMIIFKNAHILNTHLSLIFPYIAFQLPIAVFILSGFMRSIPHEIEESAVMDGANVFRIFISIIIPVSIPPIMTV